MFSRFVAIVIVLVAVVGLGLPTAWASPVMPGDANFDGRVDDLDASILASHWQAGSMAWTEGDFTGDGWVNDLDASVLASNWLRVAPPEPPPVHHQPEPASLAIWVVAGLCFAGSAWWRSRRKRG